MAAVPDTENPPATSRRIGLLDTARGIALVAMASYHFTWDLEFFGYIEPGTATQGLWKLYARAIASSFIFMAGVSLVLAHYPTLKPQSFVKRLAMVAGAAIAITIATAVAMPDGVIFFGILHHIAAASVIGLLFLRLPPALTVLAALAALAAPAYLRSEAFDAPYLLWIGLSEHLPRSNDYVPLLPWIGAFLLGIAATRFARAAGSLDTLAGLPQGPAVLRFGGRHSLIVYLLHQPLLIATVYLISIIVPPQKPDPMQSYLRSCETSCRAEGSQAELCSRFCACTLDKLMQQSLFEPLQSGAIQPDQDERVLQLARECTAVSQ
ncbi:heparan-alpha-glucosaminide N-acetyltransferase [Ciceribacter sp. RN22]|uniref:heparan-alpha-glucosaminide N-acetyltransferase n=1 Tax=Ciceribacter sp. RN22 TaxID=2954932 RepID=UPI00209278FA|nr:DUF1624 domain-containing protein [Ciceribacter sp. RN22]MCO6178357.1 DUF1624 domain-containing protein [Ciceribacter sp. RN22]